MLCGSEGDGAGAGLRGVGSGGDGPHLGPGWNHDGPRDFDELAAEREIAYTTVMSTMDNLHTKGWLARERDGKAYRYWPALTREQHSAQLMREVFDAGGRSELVLSHFLEQISPEESAHLRAALQRLARRTRRK